MENSGNLKKRNKAFISWERISRSKDGKSVLIHLKGSEIIVGVNALYLAKVLSEKKSA